jgi:flagellar biosynthesis protein FlhG
VAEDQTSELRRLLRQAGQTRTIAVTSGKGGVGKSNVALNLSILLSATGSRVALIDADLALANLDVLLDLNVHATLAHVIAGQKTLEQIIVDLPSGVQLVPAASGLSRLADLTDFQRAAIVQALSALEADNDIIIVDTAAGIGASVLRFATAADSVIVVTTPEPTSMADGYAVIKVLAQCGYSGQVSVLVNFAAGRQEARATYQRIAAVARQFLHLRVLDAGFVLTDGRVRQAVRRRRPFVLSYPTCPASRCIAALATKLCAGGALVQKKEGFFRRVANWFA